MTNSAIAAKSRNDEWTQAEAKVRGAAENVSEMVGHAASAAGGMLNQAACDVGKRVDNLASNAGIGIQAMSDRLSEGAPHSGMLGNASKAVTDRIHSGGEYLENAKLSGITEDFAGLVKRNPLPAVLIALGLGWYVASKLRG